MKLFKIGDYLKYSPIFIETGLAVGAGLDRALSSGFMYCKSVEAWEPFYQLGVKKYSHDDRVEIFYGESPKMLPIMLYNVYQKSVIFLDAHPAGPDTAGHIDLMENGNKSEYTQNNIITKELNVILSHRVDHIIIIDDQHGPDDDNLKYMRMMLATNPDYEFEFFDEMLEDGIFHKDKILVCIPRGTLA